MLAQELPPPAAATDRHHLNLKRKGKRKRSRQPSSSGCQTIDMRVCGSGLIGWAGLGLQFRVYRLHSLGHNLLCFLDVGRLVGFVCQPPSLKWILHRHGVLLSWDFLLVCQLHLRVYSSVSL